jgi:hypothetical protein
MTSGLGHEQQQPALEVAPCLLLLLLLLLGGDLELVNLPGYGLDAYLTLRRLDNGGWHEQVQSVMSVTTLDRSLLGIPQLLQLMHAPVAAPIADLQLQGQLSAGVCYAALAVRL